jgi:hypothetical protein
VRVPRTGANLPLAVRRLRRDPVLPACPPPDQGSHVEKGAIIRPLSVKKRDTSLPWSPRRAMACAGLACVAYECSS